MSFLPHLTRPFPRPLVRSFPCPDRSNKILSRHAQKQSSPKQTSGTVKDQPTKDGSSLPFIALAAATPRQPAEVDDEGRPKLGSRAHTLKGFRTSVSASRSLSACAAMPDAPTLKEAGNDEPDKEKGAPARKAAAPYSKFWEQVDTERGRFGTSVDDNAVPVSSQQSTDASAVAGKNTKATAVGKVGVHWGKHHHHHNNHHHHHSPPERSDEGGGRKRERPGEAAQRLREQYLLSARPNAAAAAQRERSRIQVTVAGRMGGGGSNIYAHARSNAYGRGFRGVGAGSAHGRGGRIDAPLLTHRSVPDAWVAAAAAAAEQNGGGNGGMRKATSFVHGWESHTLQAQQKTNEYMQGREDLAPDMRPDVVLDNEVRSCVCVGGKKIAGLLRRISFVVASIALLNGHAVRVKHPFCMVQCSLSVRASLSRK